MDRWVCCECGQEAVGHVAKDKRHFFFCPDHWDIYVGIKPGMIRSMQPKKVFLYERQLEMPGCMRYFPFASGLLVSFAQKYLPSWSFIINQPADNPDIAAFSVSLWNLNFSINLAREIKKEYPQCRIIFGGPSAAQVNFAGAEIIHGEGEAQFLKAISGIDAPIQRLDDVPSPYVTGVFDGIEGSQAIIETNRGCPFECAYCFWGKGSKHVQFHSLDFVREEAEWMGINKIPYVFCADGNFGMFPRDIEIARIYADVKMRYGYPEKFRVCYGKNAEESIFDAATILAEARLTKSVTISPQTRNPYSLDLIGRKNIKDDFFEKMQAKYDAAGIPVYSELILGLPGETYQSFKDGLLKTMSHGNQLFVYFCECLPATRMAEENYLKVHGIETVDVPLTPAHCRPLYPIEQEKIVVGTNTMSRKEWKRAAVLSWMIQLYYSFKLLDFCPQKIMDYCLYQITMKNSMTAYLEQKVEDILHGRGRCDLIDGIYFEPEEVLYLKYFGKGHNPVEEVIHARKNNFKKIERELICR